MPPTTKAKHAPATAKSGFRIAARAGAGAYTGRAAGIKKQLIHKAKVKKEYFGMLKKEKAQLNASSSSHEGDSSTSIQKELMLSSSQQDVIPRRKQRPKQSQPVQPDQPERKTQAQITAEREAAAERRADVKLVYSSKKGKKQPRFGARMGVVLDRVKKQLSKA